MTETGGLSPGGERPPVSLMDLFRDLPKPLLFQALTHPHSVEDRTESYERLEFLGDSVLGLAVAARLYEWLPGANEGRLAKIKAYAVSRTSCGIVARSLGLPEFILYASPVAEEERREMAENLTLLGNVLEALVGAAFLAFGYASVAGRVADAFSARMDHALQHMVDCKSALQEALAAEGKTVAYTVVNQAGPPHERMFTSIVSIDGREYGRGMGRSIKKSEQAAALEALARLGLLNRGEHEWRS